MTNIVIAGRRASFRHVAIQKYQSLIPLRLQARRLGELATVDRLNAQMRRLHRFIQQRNVNA